MRLNIRANVGVRVGVRVIIRQEFGKSHLNRLVVARSTGLNSDPANSTYHNV